MSKEPTSKGPPESGDEANARRRRRRRGGGLRVPSDKVPRAQSQGDSDLGDPPEPPEPEAPELAVSVASAFGGSEDEQEGAGHASSGGDPGAQSASEPAEGDAGNAVPDDAGDASAEGEDAAGDEEEESSLERDRVSAPDAASTPSEGAEERAPSAQGATAANGAAESSGDHEHSEDVVGAAAVGSAREVAAETSAEEESAKEESAEEEGAEGESAKESEEEERVGYDSVDIPIEDDAAPQRRMPRAQTEALSEEELEELMEPMEDEEAGPSQGEEGGGDEADVDFDARETAQFVPVVIEEPEEESAAATSDSEGDAGDPAVPTAVTHLEHRGIDAPKEQGEGGAHARDAGDSGEILSDELVEEIEDAGSGAASAAPSAAAFDVSGPVEGNRGAPLLGAEEYREVKEGEAREQDAPARAPDPPPVPDSVPAAKPPPAPAASGVTSQADKGGASAYGRAWFDEIFDEDYLRTLPFLTPQATQAEAKFVADAIAAAPGAQVLDVGCGYGRHAMELAARGLHVVGLDSSLPLLLRGADEAQRRGLTINFVHGDMRELTFESQFDAAYCLFSTFGYFDDETNKKTAQNIARALKPGARFVIEVLNRDYLIQDLPTRVWWEGDGCVVLEEVDFNYFSSRIVSNRSVVFDDGRQLEQEISIRAYSLHELGKLLHAAGFRVLEVSGSMNTRGRFFGARARDIIVVAEKRGPSS